MKYLITHLLLVSAISLKSQQGHSVGYNYDANGNREQRHFVGLRINLDLPQADSSESKSDNNQLALEYGLSVYPNPTTDELHILFSEALTANKDISKTVFYISDISGKTVISKNYTQINTLLNLKDFPAGNYYLKIAINRKDMVNYKIIKVN